MADNVTLPGTGDDVAADDVSGVYYQRVKLDVGGDGASTPVTSTGLPVNDAGGSITVDGPLTDTQLRATPVPVSGTVTATTGGLTDTQLRATPVPVSGTVTATTGGLTDTQLRATAVPVSGTVTASGPLTDTQLRASAVPISVATIPSHAVTNAGTFATQVTSLASTSTPSWTDGVAVLAITTLAKGAVSRSTYNLSNKPGAYLSMFIGRTGTTALDVGIAVRVRRTIATSPIIQVPGAAVFSATSDVAAAVSGVAAASGNNAGVTTLTLNAAKTFVAGTSGDIILAVLDSTSAPTTASEFVRQSFATSTTAKLLDAPTISAHNSTAHTVSDKSNMWQCWIEGGCIVEVIFDYGAATTGDTVVIGAYAQQLNSTVSV